MELPLGKDSNTVVLDATSVTVSPQNSKFFGFVGPFIPIIPFWASNAKTNFWFVISLLPQNGSIAFDPMKAALDAGQGNKLLAKGFTGPIKLEHIGSETWTDIVNPAYANASVGPLLVSSEVFFGVAFDVATISPDQRFTLLLEGLEGEDGPIDVPRLVFKMEKIRHFVFLTFDPLNVRKQWVVSDH